MRTTSCFIFFQGRNILALNINEFFKLTTQENQKHLHKESDLIYEGRDNQIER